MDFFFHLCENFFLLILKILARTFCQFLTFFFYHIIHMNKIQVFHTIFVIHLISKFSIPRFFLDIKLLQM